MIRVFLRCVSEAEDAEITEVKGVFGRALS
jgi:hypothetical protein